MQQQPPADLLVTTDVAAVDRQYRALFVGTIACLVIGAILLVVVTVVLVDHLIRGWSTSFVLPSVVIALGVVACAVATSIVVRRRWLAARGLRERVQVDAHGIVAWLPTGGVVRAPWQAVLGARRTGDGRWARMTLQVDPRLVEGRLSDADRQRIAARGIVLDAAGMQPELALVAHAMAVRTQGRVVA